MIVAVNDGAGVSLLEIALEGPVVGEAERDQCAGGGYRLNRDDVPSIV
ncbi:hypothetical protein GALL_430230 [mine drainage metagenome]|uniref:Uncharacterized protein n=1 Tax=mine drainage metagenome TaxID=410659 RepID=A0A1J5QH48_9ZZZZ